MVDDQIKQKFAHRLRLRVCGLCWLDDKLLMVNHTGLSDSNFWSPPGGGVDFGKDVLTALRDEFREETGLDIAPGAHLFTCEFLRSPLHAVEMFFETTVTDGELKKGFDPELDAFSQIIVDVRFMEIDEILALGPAERHGIFDHVKSAGGLKKLRGYYRI